MNEEKKTVDFLFYEATQARQERTVRRLTFGIIGVSILLTVTNILWVILWLL